ncbi:MAG: PHP domain-containing protein, partial [Clostridia bacterium]|nr:PHP domain-containing protein [Clostridia bacterium]
MIKDVDLHIHSCYSDGTYKVEELLEMIRTSNIRTFSITDHDTLDSCFAMRELSRGWTALRGLTYFDGVEFSCKYKNIDLHMLGYGFNLDDKRIQELAARAKQNRREKTVRLVEYLRTEHKIEIPMEEQDKLYSSKSNIGKPNFANILIKMGYGSDVAEVIDKYMNAFKSFDLKIEAEEAIDTIKKAFGFSVLAHPLIITEDFGWSYADID